MKKKIIKRAPGGGRKPKYGDGVKTCMVGIRVPVQFKRETVKLLAKLADGYINRISLNS